MQDTVFIVPTDVGFYVVGQAGELGGPYDTEQQAFIAGREFASAVEIVRDAQSIGGLFAEDVFDDEEEN